MIHIPSTKHFIKKRNWPIRFFARRWYFPGEKKSAIGQKKTFAMLKTGQIFVWMNYIVYIEILAKLKSYNFHIWSKIGLKLKLGPHLFIDQIRLGMCHTNQKTLKYLPKTCQNLQKWWFGQICPLVSKVLKWMVWLGIFGKLPHNFPHGTLLPIPNTNNRESIFVIFQEFW